MRTLLPAVVMLVTAASAFAGESASGTIPLRLELYPNFQTFSVYAYYSGDSNSNNDARLEYRIARGQWREGHRLTRVGNDLWTGSVFWLEPGTEYEARVTFADPDGASGAPLAGSVTTRSDKWATGSGRIIHVAPGGRGNGAASSPLGSVQQAVDIAGPGDTVLLSAGVYRESVAVKNSGMRNAYILIKGEPGAILDGSDAGFLDRTGRDRWGSMPSPRGGKGRSAEDFVADCNWHVGYVSVNDEKLYGYKTLEEMVRCPSGAPGGWYQDLEKGKLYLHMTRSYVDPDIAKVVVSRLDYGMLLDGTSFVVIDGLEVRCFGKAGIDIRGSDNVIQNCLVHDQDLGINIYGKAYNNNTIQDCHVFQTSVYRWPWYLTKGTRYEVDNISGRGGRGTVIRRNRVHGSFDGIGLSVWEALREPGWMQDTDINDNYIYDCGDDGCEPEGTCTNLRFFNNRIHNALMDMSIAPVTVGPAYFVNETYWAPELGILKLKSHTSGVVYIYNCTFVSDGWRQAVWDYPEDWTNIHFANCIFFATGYVWNDSGPSRRGTVSFDYDDLYTTDTERFVVWEGQAFHDLAEMQKAGLEAHGICADPEFVDPAAEDFSLQPGSPCIDKGLHVPGINDGFAGRAPDMGAHEWRPPARR
jgi:hypothetical protein